MTIFSPSNYGLRSNRPTGFQTANAESERRRIEAAARDADPVEQAVRYLRTRGRVVFRASVDGGPHDKWKMNGRLFTGAQVIAQADQLRSLTERLRPAPVIMAPAANDRPISFIAPKALPVPVSTPAARTTADRKKDAEMADIAELERCKARGTTPARVQNHLRRLQTALGVSGCADRLCLGKSTIVNCLGGHAPVRDGILNALYGPSGSTLLPHLAADLALLAAQTAPEPAVAAPAAAGIMPEIAGVVIDTPADLQPLLEQNAAHDAMLADAAPADYQPEAEVVTEGKPYDAAAEETGHVADAGEMVATVATQAAPVDTAPQPEYGAVSGRVTSVTTTKQLHALDIDPGLASLNVADLLFIAERRRATLRTELAAIDAQIAAVLQLAGVAA